MGIKKLNGHIFFKLAPRGSNQSEFESSREKKHD